jgi:hypothetical protein
MVSGSSRNDPCPCGSGRKYKKCCLELDQAVARAAPAGRGSEDAGALTLIVPTPGGQLVTRIRPASPLNEDEPQGDAAETAARDAVAVWGLPDFVYRPSLRKLGSGSRELGDAVVIVGNQGLVVQVKSRVDATEDAARERSWLAKKAAEACRQAKGTVRQLRRESAQFVNARGRALNVDGNALRWLNVVVLDHPEAPDGVVPDTPGDTVVLLRRDWEWLFEHLKSTHLVAQYLRRVAGEAVELGGEPVRYYNKARSDPAAEPDGVPAALLSPDGRAFSAPQLPMLAVGDEPGLDNGHLLLRSVMEDIATGPFDPARERERLHVLAQIDRLPVALRGDFGRVMMSALQEVLGAVPGETLWRFRLIRGEGGRFHVGFGACSASSEMHRDAFSWWVQLRHHQLQQLTGIEDLTTVGILLTHRTDGQRPWDTTMVSVRGDLELTEEEIETFERMWDRDSRIVPHSDAIA